MTALVLANNNLIVPFLLIGLIVSFSRLGGGNPNSSIAGL
jgi:hypothetical protein